MAPTYSFKSPKIDPPALIHKIRVIRVLVLIRLCDAACLVPIPLQQPSP